MVKACDNDTDRIDGPQKDIEKCLNHRKALRKIRLNSKTTRRSQLSFEIVFNDNKYIRNYIGKMKTPKEALKTS